MGVLVRVRDAHDGAAPQHAHCHVRCCLAAAIAHAAIVATQGIGPWVWPNFRTPSPTCRAQDGHDLCRLLKVIDDQLSLPLRAKDARSSEHLADAATTKRAGAAVRSDVPALGLVAPAGEGAPEEGADEEEGPRQETLRYQLGESRVQIPAYTRQTDQYSPTRNSWRATGNAVIRTYGESNSEKGIGAAQGGGVGKRSSR